MKMKCLAFCLHLKTSKTEEEERYNFDSQGLVALVASKVAKQMVSLHLNLQFKTVKFRPQLGLSLYPGFRVSSRMKQITAYKYGKTNFQEAWCKIQSSDIYLFIINHFNMGMSNCLRYLFDVQLHYWGASSSSNER